MQARVNATGRQKVPVVALFGQHALIEDKHRLGGLSGRQPVGNRDSGSPAGQPFHRSAELNVQLGVHRRGGLIEDKQIGYRYPGPYEGNELAFTRG